MLIVIPYGFKNFETLFIIKQEEIWLLRSLGLMKHLSRFQY